MRSGRPPGVKPRCCFWVRVGATLHLGMFHLSTSSSACDAAPLPCNYMWASREEIPNRRETAEVSQRVREPGQVQTSRRFVHPERPTHTHTQSQIFLSLATTFIFISDFKLHNLGIKKASWKFPIKTKD